MGWGCRPPTRPQQNMRASAGLTMPSVPYHSTYDTYICMMRMYGIGSTYSMLVSIRSLSRSEHTRPLDAVAWHSGMIVYLLAHSSVAAFVHSVAANGLAYLAILQTVEIRTPVVSVSALTVRMIRVNLPPLVHKSIHAVDFLNFPHAKILLVTKVAVKIGPKAHEKPGFAEHTGGLGVIPPVCCNKSC